jgi:uncharacterized membrane protein YqjE
LETGLFSSARQVAGALLALGSARLQLASVELEEERLRLQQLALWAVLAVFFLGVGLIIATVWLVVLLWEGPRVVVLAGAALCYLGAGLWAAARCQRLVRDKPALLAATLAELQRDAAALTGRQP